MIPGATTGVKLACSLRRVSVFVALILPFCAQSQRLPPPPALHSGETLVYRLEISGSRSTKAESLVTTPQSPPAEDLTAHCLIQVSVVEAGARGFRLKTYLSDRNVPRPSSQSPNSQSSSPDKMVEVFVAPDGTASQIKGTADLTAAQQTAWNAWLNRFTSPFTFSKGVRRGQRWKVSEKETSSSPMAELFWERRYEYVNQESCGLTGQGAGKGKAGKAAFAADSCAVIFVHAQLRQKSSPKNTTPEDYKRRGLATSGTATGTNETILYVSTKTGLLVRSNEDVQQSMDVTVALADDSNKVRYLINAKSRQQVQLLPDAPQDVR